MCKPLTMEISMEKSDNLITYECLKCGHSWYPNNEKVYICPKCKSAKWIEKVVWKKVNKPVSSINI